MPIDPPILFTRPGQISAEDRAMLREHAGVLVIECDDPASMKLIRASAELSSSDLLFAAAKAIKETRYTDVRDRFARAVCNLLVQEEAHHAD